MISVILQALSPKVIVDGFWPEHRNNHERCTVGYGLASFEAGKDVHVVIETMWGHSLGRVILGSCTEKHWHGRFRASQMIEVLQAPRAE